MKKSNLYLVIIVSLLGVSGCNEKDDQVPPVVPPVLSVTSAELFKDLLFVNTAGYQIQTNIPALFSSTDPKVQVNSYGLIQRITSGEVGIITATSTSDPSVKINIYAVGATDDSHDAPQSMFNGQKATDPFNAYKQGWETLQKLPVTGETYAIILRHADANNGIDRPGGPANWWKSCDQSLARQLNDLGRARSVELGIIFKDLQLPITRVISSEFCRASATAQLMNIGPAITIDGRANHPEYTVYGKGLFPGMIEIMKEQAVDNNMTLMVAHHPMNETDSRLYPSFPNVSPFNWAGGYFIKIAPDKTITYQGAVSFAMFKYWRDLKLKRL